MNCSIFARFSSLCLVFVPAVTACSMTDIAGEVGVGSVGGQTSAGGATNTVGGQVSTVGGTTNNNAGGTANTSAGGTVVNSGTTPVTASVGLPCDVLQDAGNPCVAAHSTVRLLVSGYSGPLYQIQRTSDNAVQDIGTVNGYADAGLQQVFCAGHVCYIVTVYDQSGHSNDLAPAPGGGNKTTPDNPAVATELPTNIGGRSVYGIRIKPGMGYRKLVGNATAKGDEPQTIYMVTTQMSLVNGCCFDYGNAETTARDDGNGNVEALYFGSGVIWGTGSGSGPWVMADLENGLFAGWERGQDKSISTNTSINYNFVTALLVGDTADKNNGKGRFALYGGDATSGALKTMYDGIRPEKPGYVPMQKQGSIVLGIAGDNSAAGGGLFYEGVMASGAATRQTVDALQASVVAAGYGQGML